MFYYSFQTDPKKTKKILALKNKQKINTKNLNITKKNLKKSRYLCNQISHAQNFFECICKPGFSGLNCNQGKHKNFFYS